MAFAIEAAGLTKLYGRTPGIVDLDLAVEVGEVFGFLGPNGAGKSTTIRTLLDFLHPTTGTARVLGLDTHRDSLAIRRRVGYLPADLALYPEMTGREMLQFFGALRGANLDKSAEALAERFGLDLDRRNGDYSSGNRQKVGIVQAFMGDPELLILDEPTSGLDPLVQQEFYLLVDEVRSQGRTVFLSSHVLPEVERLADRVGIVRRSRLVAVETVESIKAKALRRIEIRFAEAVDAALFAALPGVQRSIGTPDGRGVTIDVAGTVEQVLRVASAHPIEDLRARDRDLEEIFLAYYAQPDG
jgi:ABC-2 type transport system ATP-binding protein